MKDSAVQRALAIPEIVALIVEKGEDVWRFVNYYIEYALLSRVWLEPVLNWMWRNGDQLERINVNFLTMPDARQQYYADKVQKLGACDDIWAIVARSRVPFKNLRRLDLRPPHYTRWNDPAVPMDTWIDKLKIENLDTLQLHDDRYTEQEALLSAVATRCRRLKRLKINGRHANLDTMVKSLQQLEKFSLQRRSYYDEFTQDCRLLSCLIACPLIESINIPRITAPELEQVEKAHDGEQFVFAKLKKLATHSDMLSIPRLVRLLNSSTFKSLELRVDLDPDVPSSETAVVVRLDALRNLTALDLSFDDKFTLLPADIQALGSFSKLHKLKIHGPFSGDRDTGLMSTSLSAPGLTDAVLAEISRSWAELRSLNLHVRHNLTSASLITLGRTCRQLETLKTMGIFDVRLLSNEEEVLFPAMETLVFSRALWGEHAGTDTEPVDYGRLIIDTLFRHTPKLQRPWPTYKGIFVWDGSRDGTKNQGKFGKRVKYYGEQGVDGGPVQDDSEDEHSD